MIELLRFDNISDIKKEFKNIGVDIRAFALMDKKALCYAIRVFDCKFYHANILKQEALSIGCDVAVEKSTITAETRITNCLIFGDVKRLLRLAEKLKKQDFEFLRTLGKKLEIYLKNALKEEAVFAFKDRRFVLKDNFLIMGILNVTPDSFSDGGKFNSLDRALEHTQQMIEEGADIIDIGGESTRPNAEAVELDEELKRVLPVVEAIKKRFNVIVSVDTYKSEVAKRALDAGADIINDISGLSFDDKMVDVLKASDCGIVAMHIKGTPKNMQKNPTYSHMIAEINSKFENIIKKIEKANINIERLILDPGIGFGKRFDDNLTIINHLEGFKIWGRPILIGTSRKSFIGAALNIEKPTQRLYGTIASNVVAYIKGARIFRVHDVKEHKDALKLARCIARESIHPE